MLSNALSSCLLFQGVRTFFRAVVPLGLPAEQRGREFSRSEDKTSLAEEERSEDAPLSFARK